MTNEFRGQFGALTVDAQVGERRLRVSLAGELDVASVQPLRDVIGRYANANRRDVYVDCGALVFIDSSGLGLFVRLHKALGESDRALVLTDLSPQCRRVFEVTGLAEVLRIE